MPSQLQSSLEWGPGYDLWSLGQARAELVSWQGKGGLPRVFSLPRPGELLLLQDRAVSKVRSPHRAGR